METRDRKDVNSMIDDSHESIADVSVSLSKQMILDEIDKRINRLYKHSQKVKGAEKKSYEDTCTSFVLFKMWLQKQ